MGIRLRRGRTFSEADGENAAGVAVINETMARQYFGDTDALGQIIEARINQGNPNLADDRPREIVGVVADTRMRLRDDPRPMIYVPYQQHLVDYAGTGPFYLHARKDFAIRTELADPAAVANAVRQIVADVDASVAVDNVVPMRERLSESAGERTFLVAPARTLRRTRRFSRGRRHLRRDRLRRRTARPRVQHTNGARRRTAGHHPFRRPRRPDRHR